MNQSICACGKRRRNFASNGIVCTTSPSADGLTNRIRRKSWERSDSVFKQTLSAFLQKHENDLHDQLRGANNPKTFFTVAEKRCRFCSRRTISSLVTQLNWITRRSPVKGL